jgi:hypothetical protein
LIRAKEKQMNRDGEFCTHDFNHRS